MAVPVGHSPAAESGATPSSGENMAPGKLIGGVRVPLEQGKSQPNPTPLDHVGNGMTGVPDKLMTGQDNPFTTGAGQGTGSVKRISGPTPTTGS